MKLGDRVTIIVVAVMLASFGFHYLIQRLIYVPSFDSLEKEQIGSDIRRSVQGVQRELSYLERICAEWAESEMLWNVTEKHSPATASIITQTFQMVHDRNLSLIFLLDTDGQILYSSIIDPASRRPINLNDFPQDRPWLKTNPLLLHHRTDQPFAGVALTENGPLLIAGSPIRLNESQRQARGTLLVGRFLTPTLTQQIARFADAAVTITPLYADALSPAVTAVLRQLAPTSSLATGAAQTFPSRQAPEHAPAPVAALLESNRASHKLGAIANGWPPPASYLIEPSHDSTLAAHALVRDIHGQPALLLSVTRPKTVTNRGLAAFQFSLLFSLLLVVATLLALHVFLRMAVISPLTSLTDRIRTVRETTDLPLLDMPKQHGEMALLVREFNDMTRRVRHADEERQKMHERMIEAEQLAALGEMAATLAHEIRNPIAGLSAAAQLLRKESSTEQTRERAVAEILEQVQRLDRVVNSILMFSHHWKPKRCRTDLRTLVEETCRSVLSRNHYENLLFDYGGETSLHASVDPLLFQQVIWNLTENAARATNGTGTIAWHFSRGKETVTVSVTDTGEGISEEDQDRLFKPFFTTRHDGNGLGLITCKHIIEAHGGTIEVSSAPGSGTTVTMQWPEE